LPLTRHLSLPLTSEGHRRLSALAQARGDERAHARRQGPGVYAARLARDVGPGLVAPPSEAFHVGLAFEAAVLAERAAHFDAVVLGGVRSRQ
jgi:hypothetical protein